MLRCSWFAEILAVGLVNTLMQKSMVIHMFCKGIQGGFALETISQQGKGTKGQRYSESRFEVWNLLKKLLRF